MGEVVDLHGQPAQLEDDLDFVADCCRYAENILSEEAVKKKYRFDDDTWESLGSNDALIEKIEAEKIRRIRNGSTKRERAQQLVVQAPDVLGGIMLDASASPKHRINSAKALDAFAANGPEAAPASDRFEITINLGSDTLRFDKSIAPDPNDIDPFNDTDTTPQGCFRQSRQTKRMTAVVSLFERLDKGRPPQTEEPVKQSRRHAGQKTLIKDVLANGPAPATLVEERGAAHGFTKKQLSYARRQMRVVVFQRGRKDQRPLVLGSPTTRLASRHSGQHLVHRAPGHLPHGLSAR